MKVTILGCGGSGGVPLIGNNWGSCNPDNPKNRRRRVSVLVQHAGANIVLDTSPDFRMQMLDADVGKLDAILYTHDHADHTPRIDDVRFMRGADKSQRIPAYGAPETLRTLADRFAYIFNQNTEGSGHLYKPFLEAKPVEGPFQLCGLTVTPFDQEHGFGAKTLGYRIGPMAYSTDAVDLPEGVLGDPHPLLLVHAGADPGAGRHVEADVAGRELGEGDVLPSRVGAHGGVDLVDPLIGDPAAV